jgi:carbon-monoxide dehydrogenase small subunit
VTEERHPISLRVNGEPRTAEAPARMLLSDLLRHELGLYGVHVGCEHGVCGACTILLDGAAVRSCLIFAPQADGAEITTVEGLGAPDRLHPIQQAMWEEHGLQCGFCTPGFVISIYEHLRDNPGPLDEEQAREAIGGNLCRCTGYRNIVKAVRRASGATE